MKPLKSEVTDSSTLEELGRASVQIVHDLKNQLNGLKLYATFLRKRMEKAERPEDERETVAKLIQGLERAASDMTTLVRLGRPVELRRQAGVNLLNLLSEVSRSGGAPKGDDKAEALAGEFDAAALGEAFKAIHAGARALSPRRAEDETLEVSITRDESGLTPQALIEWRGLQTATDPFHSYAGSDAIRMSLAAKIIEAHGGEARYEASTLSVRLPINAEGSAQSDE
jgi:light-regulated signal transduction histidine kinase (bacteriophytochrome)